MQQRSLQTIKSLWLFKTMACIIIILMSLFLLSHENLQAQQLAASEKEWLIDEVKSGQNSMQPLDDLLSKIEARYKVNFMYDLKLVKDKEINVQNLKSGNDLKATLEELLASTNLTYEEIGDNYYVIKRLEGEAIKKLNSNPPGKLSENGPINQNSSKNQPNIKFLTSRGLGNFIKHKQEVTVNGQVTSQEGEPLPGVNVVVQGSSEGTVTDVNGEYSLQAPEEGTLVFSFVGYMTQEETINGRSSIDISMVEDIAELEEVVVVGYGTQQKRDLTGAVSSVSSEDLKIGTFSSVDEVLQGKASGVIISQVSGKPSSQMKVRVRGINSLTSGNRPLYVVDGVPRSTEVSPSNIESIEVLKGPSATAIYGSRASNGVILITTKKGTKGDMNINYNSKVGVGTLSKKVDVLNGEEYMQAMNKIDIANGNTPEFSENEINSIGKGTDWQEEVIRNSFKEDHSLSFDGGDDNGTYLVSLNYYDEKGLIKSSDFKRYHARVNLQQETEKFSFGLNMTGTVNKRDRMKSEGITNQNAGVTNGSLEFSPVIPAEKTEEGHYPIDPYVSLANPLNILEGHFQNTDYSEVAINAFGNYEITPALSAKLRIAGDRSNYTRDLYRSTMTYLGRGTNGIADVRNSNNQYYIGEFTATYKKDFGSHNLEVLGGSTYENFQGKNLRAGISDFPTDAVKTHNLSMGNDDLDNVGSGFNENTLLSYLSRVNYIYEDKYLFTFSYRADGSSRFGEKNKFSFFPSGSFAWRLSDEDFISQIDLISNLKLRTSYGITGNQAIGNYNSLSTFRGAGSTSINNAPKSTMVQSRIPNPQLKWESTEQFNIGLNTGIFEGRISGEVDYFVKRTTDMLYRVPVPSSTGFSSFLDNIGEMENKGIEALIKTANIVGDDFTWNTSLNFSHIKNKVKDLGPVSEIVHGGLGHTPSIAIIKEGETVNSYYGHEVVGMWQEGEDPTNSAQPNAEPGFPKFKDQNNDKAINDEDLEILGNPFPDYTFGITNNFSYNNLYLSFFIRGVQGRELLNNDIVTSVYPISQGRNRLAETWNNRWTPSNPDAEYPSHFFPHRYVGSQVNSFTIKDASFIRLSNIVLGYNIPVSNLNFINKASIKFFINNVYTITDWSGYNPEANWHGTSNLEGSYNAYPLPRTYSLGIDLQF